VIAERLRAVRERIDAAARRAGREPASVELLAVSKTFPAEAVREAAAAGQRLFGENRVQEAAAKIPDCGDGIEWHLVGPLQRNKARRAVELFDVIHAVDRPELARALERAASQLGRRPRVLLEINVDEEPQKAGVAPGETKGLLEEVRACPSLVPAGLMAIPRACDDPEQVRPSFVRLRELREALCRIEPRLVELSMGMSADFEVAVEEGATLVRVGTAIFGPRHAQGGKAG
jgi:pyridoxal phosphate enzyme (YggS family)